MHYCTCAIQSMHTSACFKITEGTPYSTVWIGKMLGGLNILSEQLYLVSINGTPIFSKIRNRRGYDLKLRQFLTVLFCSVSDTVGHQILIKTVKGKAMYNNQIHSHVGSRSAGKQIIILSALP